MRFIKSDWAARSAVVKVVKSVLIIQRYYQKSDFLSIHYACRKLEVGNTFGRKGRENLITIYTF